ncbi:hypothetical protein EMIT07CA2_10543 [Brevibacillus sp. IT-7CA2]
MGDPSALQPSHASKKEVGLTSITVSVSRKTRIRLETFTAYRTSQDLDIPTLSQNGPLLNG